MAALSRERKEFLHCIFTTALEGGIGYWSQAATYRWSMAGDSNVDDLDGFIAIIGEFDESTGKYRHDKPLTINRAVIQKGLARLADKDFKVRDDIRKTALAGSAMNDAGDIDAEIADVIVQAGLFGEIIYG